MTKYASDKLCTSEILIFIYGRLKNEHYAIASTEEILEHLSFKHYTTECSHVHFETYPVEAGFVGRSDGGKKKGKPA